jgi:NAD(P)-dependent dehydrogenase (short-subunit alcohol dehydrogenase family)
MGSTHEGPLSLFDLSDRVAVVTGGSSGLGETAARALAAAGARVGVLARRTERISRLAADIGGAAATCDLADLDGVERAVGAIAERLGPPEILVNAAGAISRVVPAADESIEDVRSTLDVNLVAPLRLCQLVYPYMTTVGRGSIVNVSSISGHVGIGVIPQASYAASKLALSGLTVELAVQWAADLIRVNTIAPGFFRSEMTDGMYNDERSAAWMRRNIPLPIEGLSDDLVGPLLWLVSDAGRYVTGQTIVVDGGWTAR